MTAAIEQELWEILCPPGSPLCAADRAACADVEIDYARLLRALGAIWNVRRKSKDRWHQIYARVERRGEAAVRRARSLRRAQSERELALAHHDQKSY